MPLGWLISAASEIARPVWEAARACAGAPGDRRMWTAENRAHLEVSGIHHAGADAAAELEQRLSGREGVHSAQVNAVLGRVVVAHDETMIDPTELAEIVAEFEGDFELRSAGSPVASHQHPGNAAPLLREIGMLAGSVAGFGYAVVTAVVPGSAVPPLIPATNALVESVPWIRSAVEHRLGKETTRTLLMITGIATHTLARHPLPLVTQSFRRLCEARESVARREAWRRWESAQAARPGAHRAAACEVLPRPVPLPDGPIEHIANVSGGAALGGYATVLVTSRDPIRALATLNAGIPAAGSAGREAFASQLTNSLSHRGDLVLEPDALRRLDRLDTIVLDAPTLLTGRKQLTLAAVLTPEGDPAMLFARASSLIDLARPRRWNRRDGWATAPWSDWRDVLADDADRAAEAVRQRGGTTVVLLEDATPRAIVGIEAELDPSAEALVAAARNVGSVLLAGAGKHLACRLDVDGLLPGGNRLGASVHRLQRDGHVVAVVSGRAHAALAGADVGIGVPAFPETTPWNADVACAHRSEAHALLSAVSHARRVSRRCAALAAAGTAAGGLLGSFGPTSGATTRASTPVQVATLVALGAGTWSAMQAATLPPAPLRGRTAWHAMPARVVLGLLGSSTEGITDAEARRRRQPTEPVPEQRGLTQATLDGLVNPMTAVLGAGAALSAIFGSIVDAGMIMSVLAASALVEATQRVTTQRELARLLSASELPARTRRGGVPHTVPAGQLVAGDVIDVHAGDGIPADCRILESEGAEVDESSLTGESQLVAKSARPTGAAMVADRTSMLYQGTVLTTGRASAVVVATGLCTELGSTTQDNDEAKCGIGGVEERLNALARRTLPLSAGAGAVLLVTDLFRATPAGQAISRAVGLAVAAIPEGLPFVATVAEAAGARRLARRGVLVRSPKTIEALGRVDALCFDKTGTLTQGRIGLRQVSDGTDSRAVDDLDDTSRRVINIGVHASPERGDRPLPHPTDRAVLEGAERAGIEAENGFRASELLAELPFEPSRGFHAARTAGPDGARISVKGAPEVVLQRCSRRRRSADTVPFDHSGRAEVDEEVERLAHLGYRVLAVAERAAADTRELADADIDELDFVGLLALADPVHPTAADSVRELCAAGVDVIMITGDHPSTAEAIAAELDMLRGRRVTSGAELDAMDDDQLVAALPKIAVFARVSPAQKARIVRQLRRCDRVVAMTGDGANDVPAIKLAQVGIALGSRATPAAREAADMVIGDDRIETIAEAIVEGRGMWASVRDALSILLGGNLGEIAFTLGAGVLGTRAAPNARQLLVVNVLTDILPALAIAVRRPPGTTTEQLLAEGPEVSLGTDLTRDVRRRAVVTAGAAGLAWLLARPVGTPAQARTTGLVALITAQLGQTLAVRGHAPLVLTAAAGSLLVLVIVVQLPGVSQLLGNQPLLPHQWAIALAAAAAAGVTVRLWQRWGRPAHP